MSPEKRCVYYIDKVFNSKNIFLLTIDSAALAMIGTGVFYRMFNSILIKILYQSV